MDSFFQSLAEPESEAEKHGNHDYRPLPVLEDGCCEIAIDNSGSTSSELEPGLTVLQASVNLVASMWGLDVEVIAWNSKAVRKRLRANDINSEDGTSPRCIFPLLNLSRRPNAKISIERSPMRPACKTLFITTDGAIPSSEVSRLKDEVTGSDLLNVVAVYVSASEKPAHLNLPVFAPFMFGVYGRVAIFHWDGNSLRLLLTQCRGDPSVQDPALPVPPVDIGPDSRWEDFPIVHPPNLFRMGIPRCVEARNALWKDRGEDSPVVVARGRRFSLERVRFVLASMPVGDPGIDSFLDSTAEFLEEVVGEVQNSLQRGLFREILSLWHPRALEQNTNRLLRQGEEEEEGIRKSRRRADELYQLMVQEEDPARRRTVQQELSGITTRLFHHEDQHRRSVQEASRSVEARYNALASRLAEEDLRYRRDYSLESLSVSVNVGSNRARRASAAKAQTYDVDKAAWEFDGAHEVECDVCAVMRPQGLVACVIPDEVIATNTSNAALNDAFSLGSKNRKYLPNSSICVFCASFLASTGASCPYSRQKIATILPVVKYSRVNAARLAANVSHWLFGGKELGIELQALLAVLDDARDRGWSGVEALDFVESEYVPRVRVNFRGTGYQSMPLLKAISDLFQRRGGGFEELEGMLHPLRNRSLVSISSLARLWMRWGSLRVEDVGDEDVGDEDVGDVRNLRVEDVGDVLNRMLFKTVVGRVLGWCKDRENRKHEIVEHLPRIVESDLYDTSSGFPVRGTGRVLKSVAESRFLRTVFGRKGFEGLKSILGQEPATVVGVSLEMVTVLMHLLLKDIDYQHCTETFIMHLARKHPLVWKAFASPRAIGKEVVLELLKQLNEHVRRIEDWVHREMVPCFSPAHLLSPVVIGCGSCGLAFMHRKEIRKYLAVGPEAKERIAQTVKRRRCFHFRDVFCTDSASGMVDLTSGHSNRHRAVATILRPLLEPFDSTPKAPTRNMLLQVLAYFRRFPKGGQLYGQEFLSHIVACMFDYLEQSNRLHGQGEFPSSLAGNHNLSLCDRLSAEIAYMDRKKLLPSADGDGRSWLLKVFPPVSLKFRDPVLVEELTKPISVDELLQVTYQPPGNRKKRKRADAEAPKQTEPVAGISKNLQKKINRRPLKKKVLQPKNNKQGRK